MNECKWQHDMQLEKDCPTSAPAFLPLYLGILGFMLVYKPHVKLYNPPPNSISLYLAKIVSAKNVRSAYAYNPSYDLLRSVQASDKVLHLFSFWKYFHLMIVKVSKKYLGVQPMNFRNFQSLKIS